MHFYQIPDPGKADKAELDKLRDLADEFGVAAMKAFTGPVQLAVMRAFEPDELATLQGMDALIRTPNARGDVVEEWISLQMIDVQVGAMQRADAPRIEGCVPATMATADAADLFKKYDLPALESVTRKAIKAPKP